MSISLNATQKKYIPTVFSALLLLKEQETHYTSTCPSGGRTMSESNHLTAKPDDEPHYPVTRQTSTPSHHHVITPDIFLDRFGFEELDPSSDPHHPSGNSHADPISTMPFTDSISHHLIHELKILPTLPERMNADSLDDCFAFTDVTPPTLNHPNNLPHDIHHPISNVLGLETLTEMEEETEVSNKQQPEALSTIIQLENDTTRDRSQESEYYTAPLHLNALRMSDVRLQGSASSSGGLHSLSSRSSSRSRTSRDVSPSPQLSGHHPIDPDILLDRLGLVELEPSSFHHSLHPEPTASPSTNMIGMNNFSSSTVTLPSLPERISEETLDDCHAFTEFKFVGRPRVGSTSSLVDSGTTTPSTSGSCGNLVGLLACSLTRDGSVSGGSILGDASLLETLEEFEEEEEEDEEFSGGNEVEFGDDSHRIRKIKKWNGESSLDIIEEKESDN